LVQQPVGEEDSEIFFQHLGDERPVERIAAM
jgi:hypothetical protein